MRLHSLGGLAIVVAFVVATAGAVVVTQAAGPQPQSDVISREVSFGAGFAGPADAISREFSFGAGFAGTSDAISREVSFGVPQPDLAFDIAATELPSEGSVNQLFHVRWRVRNADTLVAAGPWTDQVQFSTPIRLAAGGSVTTHAIAGPTTLAPGAFYDRDVSFLMPPNATTFTITLRTDVTSVVQESSESNNQFGPKTVTVQGLPRPNLRVQVTAQPTANPTAGDFVALSFRVWNNGQAPTSVPQWFDGVYLVPDVDNNGIPPASEAGFVASSFFPNVYFLQNDPGGTGSLPGTSYDRVAAAVQLPTTVSGKYFLAVRTDALQAQVETSESDNLAFSSVFTIQEAPRPDLEVNTVAIALATPGTPLSSGSVHTVTWNVLNRGPATYSGGSFTTEIWVSTNLQTAGAGALASDLRLTSFSDNLPALGVGSASSRSHDIFLPPGLTFDLPSVGGLYTFKVRIDANDGVLEHETLGALPYWNNLAAHGTFPVLLSATPDLIADSIGLAQGQTTPQAAHAMKVAWTVRNPEVSHWNLPLSWRDQVWLSKGNAVIDGTDLLLGTFTESTVQLGGEWVVPSIYPKTTTVVLPNSIQAGTYFLILLTDANGEIFEFSGGGESNNVVASPPFAIERHPADLSIVAQAANGMLLAPTQGAPGQAITLPWSVANDAAAGATSVLSWTDSVMLSPSATNLAGAITVLSAAHSGVLQPAGSYTEVRTASVPYVTPGTSWWLHFITDVGGTVFEDGATSNNFVVTPFQVTNLVADLAVDQVSATQRMRAGQPVSVHWTVRNSGSAATGAASWIDTIYLADDPDLAHASSLWTLASWLHSAALGSGSSYSVSRSFDLPLGLSPGAWYVVARSDTAGQVFELDENNNTRATRTLVEIDAPGPGGGGGGGGVTGGGWLPANLVPRGIQILNGPVTAGQNVQLSWEIANEGIGVTNQNSWTDSVYLSLDGALDATDQFLGFHQHTSFLDVGEARLVTESFTVPLGASAAWVVLVKTNSNDAVFQDGATSDDVAASAALLHVTAPPFTDLAVTSIDLPPSVLLGESLAFAWTTRNDSQADIPAAWSWTDGFWLLPDAACVPSPSTPCFPSPDAQFLGHIESNAGAILANGGTHTQNSAASVPGLTIPGLMPGFYRVVAQTDTLSQVAELDDADNVQISSVRVELRAIDLLSGSSATADLANGSSRWFRLIAPADQTIDLDFEHDDPSARCELYVRETTPPSLGAFDWASQGLDAIDAHLQSVRIPRTSGNDYFVLVRTVSGAGAATGAHIDAISRDFGVADVKPATVGAGIVTIEIDGSELWRASSIELREVTGGGGIAQSLETVLLEDGTLLARFNLTGASLGARDLVVIDGIAAVEAAWSGSVVVVPPEPLTLRADLDVAPNVRRGERGAGVLRLTNAGNVDVPYAMASLGHLHQPGAVDAVQRVTIVGPEQPLGALGGGSDRESLVAVVEDLRPGGAHEVALEFAVGAEYPLEGAAFGVASVPATKQAFLQGAFLELSHTLRVAVASDPTTPALLSGVVQDPRAWDALVAAGVASESIGIDTGSVHLPSSPARTAREILQSIADGVAAELPLPTGTAVPPSAIDGAARTVWCAPFAGLGFDCESLFPPECSGGSADVGVTTSAGLNVPAGSVCMATPAPHDPNEKLPQPGVGPQGLVSANHPVNYQVQFENQADASAWASRIVIRDALEPGFRSSSVRFKALRIGRTTFPFPPSTSSYVGQIPLSIDETTTILCQVSALVDAFTDTILVTLQALDPVTGLPNSAGNRGLLPPNAVGLEQAATGYLAFSVRPEAEALGALVASTSSGQIIVNTTTIQMNAAPPLQTNTTHNMLDGRAPGSALVVDSVIESAIHLSWNAADTENLSSGEFSGSGVRTYSLSVGPTEKGPWTPVVTDTHATSHVFTAALGETRAFKIEATDEVGNAELKDVADVIVPLPPDCNANGISDAQDIADGTLVDQDANGVPDVCECAGVNFCVSTPDSIGLMAHISGVGVASVSSGNFTLKVSQTPPSRRGIFLYGTDTQQTPFGGGVLCLSGTVIRLQPLLLTDATGSASLPLNFSGPPLGIGPTQIAPGSTRYFQFWFQNRDPMTNTRVDLSDALKVTFCN